jgi:hypothetical protein
LVSAAIKLASGGSSLDAVKAGAFAFASMRVWDTVGGFLGGAKAALGDAFN